MEIQEGNAMDRKAQHVVRRGNKWAVRKTGSARVTRKFDSQEEAIDVARRFAQNQATELYIHGPDGRIRKRDSYGNNLFPPSG